MTEEHLTTDDTAGASGESRRDLLKKAAVGGAVVWAAPAVLAGRSGAAVGSTPPPPQCTFETLTTNWDSVEVPPGGFTKFGYDGAGSDIGTTGWDGTNVDLVSGTFSSSPPWTGGSNWFDLVGSGNAGSIATTVVACAGTYELTFTYSEYNGAATVSTTVAGVPDGGAVAPAPGNPAVYTRTFTVATDFTGVEIIISGTATANNVGPAIGDVTLTKTA